LYSAVLRGMGRAIEIKLTVEEREELETTVSRPSEEAALVRPARVILLSARGIEGREIALRLDLSPEHVSKIRGWFRAGGVGGLVRPRSGRKDHAVPMETEHRVVQLAMSPPPQGRSRWTTRLLGKGCGSIGAGEICASIHHPASPDVRGSRRRWLRRRRGTQ
jgi:hypothetical protein